MWNYIDNCCYTKNPKVGISKTQIKPKVTIQGRKEKEVSNRGMNQLVKSPIHGMFWPKTTKQYHNYNKFHRSV